MKNKVETAIPLLYNKMVNLSPLPEIDLPFPDQNRTKKGLAIPNSIPSTYNIYYASGTASAIPQTLSETIKETISDLIYPYKSVFVIITNTSSTQERSSIQQHVPEIIERTIASLFDTSSDEEFEYGVNSQFSNALSAFIHRYGVEGVDAIQKCIISEKVHLDTIIEALHTLARIQHPPSHYARLLMLLRNLFAESARVRCGAALGLAYMDEPRALPFLRQALEREASNSGRICLHRVIEQLEDTERSQNA